MGTKSKRMGRPKKPAKSGERVSLGLRVTAEIKSKLDDAAEKSGRSQSQEAELRLERSFINEKLHADALQAEVEARLQAEDELHRAHDLIEKLELLKLNIGTDIEKAIDSAFSKVGLKPKDAQS